MQVDETNAWNIVTKFCERIKSLDDKSLLAVFAVGSLAGGYYRLGNSDIDLSLIVKEGTEDIWESSIIKSITKEILNEYSNSIGLEVYIKYENKLFPPYRPEEQVTIEILRLKYQSKLVFGNYPVDSIVLPNKNDILNDAVFYERLIDTKYDNNPIECLDFYGIINLILRYMRLYLLASNEIIEFNKFKIIDLYKSSNPSIDDEQSSLIIKDFLFGAGSSNESLEVLKVFAYSLRRIITESLVVWMKYK